MCASATRSDTRGRTARPQTSGPAHGHSPCQWPPEAPCAATWAGRPSTSVATTGLGLLSALLTPPSPSWLCGDTSHAPAGVHLRATGGRGAPLSPGGCPPGPSKEQSVKKTCFHPQATACPRRQPCSGGAGPGPEALPASLAAPTEGRAECKGARTAPPAGLPPRTAARKASPKGDRLARQGRRVRGPLRHSPTPLPPRGGTTDPLGYGLGMEELVSAELGCMAGAGALSRWGQRRSSSAWWQPRRCTFRVPSSQGPLRTLCPPCPQVSVGHASPIRGAGTT